jgi:hypothetical protein
MDLCNEMLLDVEVPEYNSNDAMCNVTFLKNKYSTILTSDWDGNVERGYSLPPIVATYGTKKVMFTRDEKTGGSWFAATDNGDIAVVMNNKAKDHINKENHLKSSSLILLEIISADSPFDVFAELNLQPIEPFSIVLYSNSKLYELIWDGDGKSINAPDTDSEHLWALAPEFGEGSLAEKEKQFKDFLIKKPKPYAAAIRTFHKELCKAFSITQAVLMSNNIMFYHMDMLDNKFYICSLPLKNTPFIIND